MNRGAVHNVSGKKHGRRYNFRGRRAKTVLKPLLPQEDYLFEENDELGINEAASNWKNRLIIQF
jgi:hypothetical protein